MISILRRGTPLLVNEFLWSSGMAVLLQCYSVRGLDVVAACNIATTVSNLFKVVFLSMGNAVAIMVRAGARRERYRAGEKLHVAADDGCLSVPT